MDVTTISSVDYKVAAENTIARDVTYNILVSGDGETTNVKTVSPHLQP